MPTREQPYATIVTKDYPDDVLSALHGPGRWRVNIRVGTEAFIGLTGEHPREAATEWDHAATDVVLPHPVHRAQGWVSIVNPGAGTYGLAVRLLRQAHEDARRRASRRGSTAAPGTVADQRGGR